MYRENRDRAEFFLVYIREAHPTDGWTLDGNVKLADPKTSAERHDAAGTCTKSLDLSMPVVVDDMEDTVNRAYAAWPERLYVIGKDGKIAYAGGMGPFKFDPAECAKFLRDYFAKPANAKSKD
ncbi:MAG: hypothetical protein HYR85_23120 [Planctomycetes bacterium]|nr:hypothetical protein [Planctomycetota bacterium]